MYLGLWRFLGAALLGAMRFIELHTAHARLLLAQCGHTQRPIRTSDLDSKMSASKPLDRTQRPYASTETAWDRSTVGTHGSNEASNA